MQQEAVRWNVTVSRETDLALCAFLGSQGMKKVDLSRFVERVVLAHVFHRTIKARNAGTDTDESQALIDDMVREVRAERRARAKADRA